MTGGRALVTGAGGFMGSHLCERLVRDGVAVRAFCRYTSRREIGNLAHLPDEVRGEVEVLFGDLLDADFVRASTLDCDTVFHLGASISVPYSYLAPREVVRTNVEGTLNVLTAARELQPRTVVQMSSSEVYGTAQYAPIDERHPLRPQSPYAASKVGADKLAESFHLSYDLPVVIARPFNTYGPRQSRRAVIATLAAQAVAGERVSLGATSPTRDFVFVSDTVDALVRLAHTDDGRGETFNIATGRDTPISTLVEIIGDLLGRNLTLVTDEARLRPEASEVQQLAGDATKIRDAIGWRPTTELRAGLQAVLEWTAAHPWTIEANAYEI